MNVVIKTDKLSKYYGKGGEIKAVDEFDLEVYEGETFGLLGPNGAGKTTTVRLLNCIIKPTSGTATVNGYDILKGETDVKRVTGLLAESPGLYEKLSAHEFLEFMGALYDVPSDVLPDRIDDLLRLFSLYDRRDHLLEGYSRGMKQKIFLAAPIKPSDVLLGEFLGVTPFYAIAITVVTGFFTAALSPLGLDMLQIAITVIIFVVTCLSALWIGTVIAALVRTKFAKTARGRDIGKALSLVLALPMIAIMYAIMGGGLLEALADPGTSGMVKAFLSVLPSSWGAELIVSFASNPGNIGAVGFETLTRFGGLVIFFIVALWLGTKAANRAYSIEPTTFTASRAKPDGFFYKAVRHLGGGGSFGTLLASVFKDYGRRLENLSRIAYILGIFIMVNVFFGGGFTDPEGPLVMAQFLFPFFAVFMVGQIAVQGKESLFIYKKTPFGVRRFVKAKLVQGWLVAVPIAAVITAILLIPIPQASVVSMLSYVILIILLVAANVALALGLALLNPQFSENVRAQMGGLMINANVAMFASIGVFIGSMVVLDLGIFNTMLLQNAVIWLLGIMFLYLGKRKLSRIE